MLPKRLHYYYRLSFFRFLKGKFTKIIEGIPTFLMQFEKELIWLHFAPKYISTTLFLEEKKKEKNHLEAARFILKLKTNIKIRKCRNFPKA